MARHEFNPLRKIGISSFEQVEFSNQLERDFYTSRAWEVRIGSKSKTIQGNLGDPNIQYKSSVHARLLRLQFTIYTANGLQWEVSGMRYFFLRLVIPNELPLEFQYQGLGVAFLLIHTSTYRLRSCCCYVVLLATLILSLAVQCVYSMVNRESTPINKGHTPILVLEVGSKMIIDPAVSSSRDSSQPRQTGKLVLSLGVESGIRLDSPFCRFTSRNNSVENYGIEVIGGVWGGFQRCFYQPTPQDYKSPPQAVLPTTISQKTSKRSR